MFKAWTPRRSQCKVGQRKVKADSPRCQLRIEQCEDRLPPGQLFTFLLDPLTDLFPVPQTPNEASTAALVQSDHEVNLLVRPNPESQPVGLELATQAAAHRETVLVRSAADVWTAGYEATNALTENVLRTPFDSVFSEPAAEEARDQSTSSVAVESGLRQASGFGGRFVSPSDVGLGVPQAPVEVAVGVDQAARARDLLATALATTRTDTVTRTGTLEVFSSMNPDESHGHMRFERGRGEDRLPLVVDSAARMELEGLGGAVITVEGTMTPEGLATTLEGITVVQDPPGQDETSGPSGPSYRTVLVININFPNQIQTPWTTASVNSLFNTTIANWYYDGSYGQMSTYTDVAGWYTITANSTTCQSSTWATQAQQRASAQGYVPNAYNHVVIAFPRVSACNWSGLGQAPGRITWLNGAMNHGVAVHELGHNLGLLHSHSRRCNAGPLEGSCTQSEYGDRFDVMGNAGGRAHYHNSYRSYVGWIPASDRVLVTPAMGEVGLALYSSATPYGTRVVQVRRNGTFPAGQQALYIEWREAVGFDSVLTAYPVLLNGVAIYLGSNNNFRDQSVVDVNWQTTIANDAALQVGEVFYDYAGDLGIWPYHREDGITYLWIQYGIGG